MTRTGTILGGLAAVAILTTTACSGGGEDTSATGDGDTASAPAAPEPGTPSAESVDTVDGTVLAGFTGDASAGNAVFAQCRACHVFDEGVNRTGPSLYNIVGREAGTVAGFNYSDANANSGIVWAPEKLFQYLENPRRIMPGTRMAFGGIIDPQDRADLIAHMAVQ